MRRRTKVLHGVLAGIITASVGNTAPEQAASNLYVTEVHYEHTRQDAGQPPQIMETGTYVIAMDGRYRIDRRTSDTLTFEIFDPAQGTRTVVNPDQQRALVHATPIPRVSAPAGQMPRSLPGLDPDRIRSFIEENLSGMRIANGWALMPNQEFLGTRTIGVIELEGVRGAETMPDGTEISHEMWFYSPGSPTTLNSGDVPMAPVQLEHRFVLPGLIEEKRVTAATPAYVSADTFTVPESIAIIRERPRRRVPTPNAR